MRSNSQLNHLRVRCAGVTKLEETMRFQGIRGIGGSVALASAVALAMTAAPTHHALAGCGGSHDEMNQASMKYGDDIVDTAVSAGDFKTLVAAVQAAGLVDALKGEGPFTIFAPNDAAFAKLPKSTLESLLKPENKAELTSILTYHVVSGRVPAEQALKLDFASTLNGQRIDLKVKDGALFVDGAQVVATDIETSNGVIHVIDSVILPAQDDILQTATKAGAFKTLAAAIQAAGLIEALQAEGPFTVFAPTDEAFAALPAGTLDELLKPENRDKLTSILTYHVVPGRVYSDQALSAGAAKTLQKGKVRIAMSDGRAKVNNANLVKTDIETTNGVIHVIDTVLLLPDKEMSSTESVREIIRMAINHGAPLYNHGQPEACAAVYEVTAASLLQFAEMSVGDERVLRDALRRADRTHSANKQAWILRDALDEVYESHGLMRSAMR
jgi:uncharacterized surface protein with fasciclin (FAS1) repeats